MRYAETDAGGGVHHGEYLTYFEVARVEALRTLGVPVGEFEARGILMPVVEARLRYLRPAHLDDLLDVAVLLSAVGPASFSFDYEVMRDGVLLATGWTRMAVVDTRHGAGDPAAGLGARAARRPGHDVERGRESRARRGRRREEAGQPSKRRKTRDTSCPPKPNELDIAVRTGTTRAALGT